MPYKIAIASGKGGTGKTTLSVSLYNRMALEIEKIQLIDCDVEEPNAALFYSNASIKEKLIICQQIPEIDKNKCTYCSRCVDYCAFNAITLVPTAGIARIDPGFCHSCGACIEACEFDAIRENDVETGVVNNYQLENGLGLLEGRLEVGSSLQTFLIKQLKKKQDVSAELVILDAPPGTSCKVVQTVIDADYTLLIGEPTPFGLHDLKLSVQLLRGMNKDFGVVINKAGIGDGRLLNYLIEEDIEIVGKIPFDRGFASSYAGGDLTENIPKAVSKEVNNIGDHLLKKFSQSHGNSQCN